MKKEKESCRFNWIWIIAIVAMAINIMLLVYRVGVIEQTMPKEVCHNEYKVERIRYDGSFVIDSFIREYPIDSEIICEEGVFVHTYKHSGKKVISFCLELTEDKKCSGLDKTCLIKTKTEVCEIK